MGDAALRLYALKGEGRSRHNHEQETFTLRICIKMCKVPSQRKNISSVSTSAASYRGNLSCIRSYTVSRGCMYRFRSRKRICISLQDKYPEMSSCC